MNLSIGGYKLRAVMFFLYTVEHWSIIKLVFYAIKSCNKKIGKTDESLRRKAIWPVKW